jgi:hypothetical protein
MMGMAFLRRQNCKSTLPCHDIRVGRADMWKCLTALAALAIGAACTDRQDTTWDGIDRTDRTNRDDTTDRTDRTLRDDLTDRTDRTDRDDTTDRTVRRVESAIIAIR